ncbi:MAG: hypothetical protein HXL26_00525 [Porphyromonadaceae bacterium]|nr:hypothetical protein [Porphyromonadaceae bacterium]
MQSSSQRPPAYLPVVFGSLVLGAMVYLGWMAEHGFLHSLSLGLGIVGSIALYRGIARRYGYSEVWTFWAILTTFLVMGLAAFLSGIVFHS